VIFGALGPQLQLWRTPCARNTAQDTSVLDNDFVVINAISQAMAIRRCVPRPSPLGLVNPLRETRGSVSLTPSARRGPTSLVVRCYRYGLSTRWHAHSIYSSERELAESAVPSFASEQVSSSRLHRGTFSLQVTYLRALTCDGLFVEKAHGWKPRILIGLWRPWLEHQPGRQNCWN
jgi:hypothetical protein